MTAPDWRTSANCLALDVNDFFPEKGGSGAARVVRAICGACEVRQQCLDFAIEQGIHDGIWGGLTPNERRAVVRARKAVA